MVRWNRSIQMEERLGYKGKIVYMWGRPYYKATYEGREIKLPIIHRDSRIVGGVCLGQYPREAFFVGPESTSLERLRGDVERRASYGGHLRRDMVLEAIYKTVRENMKPDERAVERLVSRYELGEDGLVSLGLFIQEGVGVCRHFAATCGALIELFGKDKNLRKARNHLRGKASMDRNSTERGGHTWTRYRSKEGPVVILDVAQDFFGMLGDPETQRKIGDGKLWPYNRPDDLLYYF